MLRVIVGTKGGGSKFSAEKCSPSLSEIFWVAGLVWHNQISREVDKIGDYKHSREGTVLFPLGGSRAILTCAALAQKCLESLVCDCELVGSGLGGTLFSQLSSGLVAELDV